MKKRILSLLTVLLLCALFATTVFASQTETLVYDDAQLLTGNEKAELEARLAELSSAYNAQIVVATVPHLDTDVDTYLEQTYDSMGFGYGVDHDGVFMLVCMDPREYRILSNGFAGEAIDTLNIESIGDLLVEDLSEGNYAAAFEIFADECEYYLNGYVNGYPFNALFNLAIALVVGFVIALIITGVWKAQLKSVYMQRQANVYVKQDSLRITQAGDYFLYRNVTRTERHDDDDDRSSGGFRSSGGGSRSTGGGSF